MSIEAVVATIYAPPPHGTKHVGAVSVLRVWQAIAEHMNNNGEGAHCSQRELAGELGISRRELRHALGALIEQERIIKTADAIRGVRGDVYVIVCDSLSKVGGQSLPDQVGGQSLPTELAEVGGRNGRAEWAGNARPKPEPEPVTPPTPPSEHGAAAAADTAAAPSLEDLVAATMSNEDLLAISNERVREILAERTKRLRGDNVAELAPKKLFPSIDDVLDQAPETGGSTGAFARLEAEYRKRSS